MESLYFLIPLSIVVLALGLGLFFWAVNSGQYDDLDGEAERILFDDFDTHTPFKPDEVEPQQTIPSSQVELVSDIAGEAAYKETDQKPANKARPK